MTILNIRPTEVRDLEALAGVVERTELFPSEMLADMAAPALAGQTEAVWLTALAEDAPVGFAFAAPEDMADNVWNMRALAVDPNAQRSGAGAALVAALELHLQQLNARIMVVDTSGTEAFHGARAFYAKQGYAEQARLPDYWEDGDDKVTFLKRLATAN